MYPTTCRTARQQRLSVSGVFSVNGRNPAADEYCTFGGRYPGTFHTRCMS